MSRGLIGGITPQTPTTGSVATGQAYAQQIAGGIPFEQVVAPGLQFSPEAPMGLTQEQLNLIAQGPVPVMPEAPTIGEPVAPSIPTMPFAPVGTPMPTLPFIQRKFDMTEIGEPFEPDLDLFLRDIEERELADILEDIEVPSLFDFNVAQAPIMPSAPSIFDVQPISQPTPKAVVQQPFIQPMNFTGLSPQFDLPQIDEIVSPIRIGKLSQPNIFGFSNPPLMF